jgi:hypothetical protein
MDRDYKASKKFLVCSIQECHIPSLDKIFGLQFENQIPNASYDDAVEWIQNNGARQVDYTIIDVYRKP